MCNNNIFLFKKSIMSTYFGLSLFLLADTSSPALEKSLSDGTEVAGTHKYFLARMVSFLYW